MIMSVVWCTVEPLLPSVNTAFCRTGNGPIRPVFPWAGRGLASSLRRVFAPRITRNRPRGFGPSQVGQHGLGGGDRAVERLPHLHYRSVERSRSPRCPHSTIIAASGVRCRRSRSMA